MAIHAPTDATTTNASDAKRELRADQDRAPEVLQGDRSFSRIRQASHRRVITDAELKTKIEALRAEALDDFDITRLLLTAASEDRIQRALTRHAMSA